MNIINTSIIDIEMSSEPIDLPIFLPVRYDYELNDEEYRYPISYIYNTFMGAMEYHEFYKQEMISVVNHKERIRLKNLDM